MKTKLELIQEIQNILKENNITSIDLMGLDYEYKVLAVSDAEPDIYDEGYIELASKEQAGRKTGRAKK